MPPTDQLLDLDGIRQRTDRFRFDLEDQGGAVIGELTPQAASTPSITNDMMRRVPRTLDGLQLSPSDAAAVDIFRDRVRPVMILQNGAEFSLGRFLWGDDSRPLRSWGLERRSSLLDRSFILDQDIGRPLGVGRGGSLGLAALATVLDVITLDEIVSDGIDAPAGAPMAWPPSTTRAGILGDIHPQLGVLPVFFDREDRLNFRAVPETATAQPSLIYEAGGRIVADSIVLANDLLRAPNRYVVYDSSGSGAPVLGRWDIPDSAPHSIANRGFPVVLTQSMQGIGDARRAFWAARSLAQSDRANVFETIEWSSTLDPRHDSYDVVQVLGQVYLEIAWRMTLRSGGLMTHKARRVYS